MALLLSGSGRNRVVAPWTLLVGAALIAALVLNWAVWERGYGGEDDTGNGIQWGVATFLVIGGFLVWCFGLLVIAAILEVLDRRRGFALEGTYNRRDSSRARGFFPNSRSGRPSSDGKWPG